jgi:dTDP-4-amino-4,6-dideoxygalactose transaminase
VRHTFFWCPVQILEDVLKTSTKELIGYLKDSGIETRNRYWEPLYKQKILVEKEKYPHRVNFASNNIDYSSIRLKNAETVAGKIIGLPNHPGLSQEELDRVVEVLTGI